MRKDKPNDASDELYVLSRGLDNRVTTASSYISNGIHYSTYEREKHLKTQNSGITAKGDHFTTRMKKSESFDHYGRVTEVIQLSYNDKENTRDVVLFKWHWYDQDRNMGRAPRNDGNFISINTTAQWYKNEPYILVPQASKVMFLDDRSSLGRKYVQKFQPRNIYDVDENKLPRKEVAHQDDFCGSGETEADEKILMDIGDHAHDG